MRVLAVAVAIVLLVAPSAEAVPPGTFTRMFPKLAPFNTPTEQELATLAGKMLDPRDGGRIDESPDNGAVPAGVTFLGQFIDHDLTLDTEPSPLAPVNIKHLDNDRNGNFDLDSVYGDGPSRTPELYEANGSGKLRIEPNVNGVLDVPRRDDGSAILGDGRNDENLIVVQLHVAFLRFHNRLITEGHSFADAQRLTRYHYQWIVLHEYLPDILGLCTDDTHPERCQVPTGTNEFYKPGNKHDPVLPIEFSVAAFRFGHSEVRSGYALNGSAGGPTFSSTVPDLRGGRPIPAGHEIEWQRFFKIDGSTPQPSKPIDTKISRALFSLPLSDGRPNVLAFRNMMRGKFYGLPSGQAVASAMGETPLPAGQGPGFERATPLWFYILLESEQDVDGDGKGGKHLGPVGARIVTEVFLTNLQRDPGSYLNAKPGFQPSVPYERPYFTMSDFLHFAAGA